MASNAASSMQCSANGTETARAVEGSLGCDDRLGRCTHVAFRCFVQRTIDRNSLIPRFAATQFHFLPQNRATSCNDLGWSLLLSTVSENRIMFNFRGPTACMMTQPAGCRAPWRKSLNQFEAKPRKCRLPFKAETIRIRKFV